MGSVAWATWLWLAATWRVDGDATECPGDGSEGAPFCTLQDAFSNDALAGGDEIVVRDAAMPYEGGLVANVDGEAGAPIVLRPEDGHAPRIRGRVDLASSSYWTVRDLTFDGAGAEEEDFAIGVDTGAEIVEGIVVEGNTIVGWGGPLVTDPLAGITSGLITLASYPGASDPSMIAPVVRNNRILDSRGKGIFFTNVVGGTIEGNEITGLTCQMEGNGPGMSAVHVAGSVDVVVARNRIHDLDVGECTLDDERRVIGIWIHNASNTEVHHNLVQRIGGGQGQEGQGINLIQSTVDTSIHHNIVVDADDCGLCNGVFASDGGDRARFVANTVIGGRGAGLALYSGNESEFIGNVVVGAQGAQVRLFREGTVAPSVWTFENNLYLPPPGEDNIARFEYDAPVDFATWSAGCVCDASSLVADPMLPSGGTEDFTAPPGSPVIDGGVELPEVEAWNGEGVDLGAVEAPIFVGASIGAGEPDVIRVVLQSETSPLRHDPACSGFSIAIDDEPVSAVACELDGDTIAVRLAETAHAGDTVALAYAGSSISNSDAIGGVVNGLLQAFEVEVDNGSQEVPPAESGDDDPTDGSGEPTSGSGDPSGTDATASGNASATASETDTDSGGASYPGVEGCSCSTRPHAWPLWLLVLPFAWRRRAISRP